MPNFQLLSSLFASPFTTLIIFLSAFMASPASKKKTDTAYTFLPASAVGQKPSSRRTVHIETEVSNFKDVVQKFTALREENPPQMQAAHKGGGPPPPAYPRPDAGKQPSLDVGARGLGLKLHERRRNVRVPEIKVNNNGGGLDCGGKSGLSSSSSSSSSSSPTSSSGTSKRTVRIFGSNFNKVTVSPMKKLACGNTEALPRTTCSAPLDEQMRGIYERVYYWHPNSDTPQAAKPLPLLPLFPLHPTGFGFDKDADQNEDSNSCA